MKNARGHSPLDLATATETRNLILKATKTKYCQICKDKFTFKNIRYFCQSSDMFICSNCKVNDWVYENHESKDPERLVCRSLPVDKLVKQHETELRTAIEVNEFTALDQAINKCGKTDIDVKLKHKAEILHMKLEHELKLQTFLQNNIHHENYKDIRKDVQKIEKMINEA